MVQIYEELCYADQETWGETSSDAHLIVRETPAWKMRQNWANTKLRIQRQNLDRQLHDLHYAENVDHFLPTPTAVEQTEHNPIAKWIGFNIERFGVMFCRSFHRLPEYQPGSLYTECVCGRKYAVPWADQSKLPHDVYRQDTSIPKGPRTLQAECRGAHARIVSE